MPGSATLAWAEEGSMDSPVMDSISSASVSQQSALSHIFPARKPPLRAGCGGMYGTSFAMGLPALAMMISSPLAA